MKISRLLIIAGCIGTVLAGCQKFGEEYYKGLVPQDYYRVLSFKESGAKTMELTVDDATASCSFSVLRGGIDIETSSTAKLEILSQAELDARWNAPLGTKYQVLPNDLFELEGAEMLFERKQSNASAVITVKPAEIFAKSRTFQSGEEYVLPLKLVSETDSVNVNKSEMLLRFNVSPIVVSFTKSQVYPEMFSSQSQSKVYLEYEKTGNSAVDVSLSLMSAEEIAASYPSLAAEGYQIVDPENYSLTGSASLQNQKGEISFTVYPDKINAQKQSAGFNSVLLIPLKMTTSSDIAETRNDKVILYCFHTLCEEIQPVPGSYWGYAMEYVQMKPFDMLYGTGCCNAWGEHIMMYDGNMGTGWLTYIENGYQGSGNFGNPFVVLDFRSAILLSEIGFVPLDNSTNCRPYKITYYGTNDETVSGVQFTDSERRLMSGTDNVEGNSGYIALDRKMREHDRTVSWEKIAVVEDAMTVQPGEDRYVWTAVPSSLIENRTKYRYFKLEVTSPDPSTGRQGDRTRIVELGIRKVVMYNGTKID